MKLYHVSDNPSLTRLTPRVPHNMAIKNGVEDGVYKS